MGIGGLPVGPRPGLTQPGQVGQGRAAAGAYRYRVPGGERGGGVGVEMASAWSGLGASVTLLAQADGLLPRMEPFAGELVGRALAEAGADVRFSSPSPRCTVRAAPAPSA